MKKRGLNVFAGSTLTGVLERSDREEDTILFTYGRGSTPETAVSLTMPVRADQYDSMAGLLPVFDMNLPEGALAERLRMQFAKAIPQFDDLDMLAIVGSSQIGRLRYSHDKALGPAVPGQDLSEILTYRGSSDLFAYLLGRFATYSGISGVQPKVLVRDMRMPEKMTHLGATHIVKSFDRAEFPELAANELICTQGAAAAGIKTARMQLSENRQFLIVDRFDLTAKGDYLGLEDFCVLDGRRSHGRYDGSYEGIAKRIGDFVTPAQLGEAREQYALMVAYACGIENGDAHLKNFGVLYEHPEAVVSLAPAYDLISTTPYIRQDSLALTLNGSKEFPDRSGLIRFVRQVTGKSGHGAAQMLDRVAIGIATAIKKAKTYSKKHPDATRFSEILTGALQRGLQRIRGLL